MANLLYSVNAWAEVIFMCQRRLSFTSSVYEYRIETCMSVHVCNHIYFVFSFFHNVIYLIHSVGKLLNTYCIAQFNYFTSTANKENLTP